jgi:hypothetical protein
MATSCIAFLERGRLAEILHWGIRRATLIGVFLGALLAAAAAAAERTAEKATTLVRKGLTAEMAGNSQAREQALSAAIELAPDLAPAHWHKGFVERDGQWTRFSEVQQDSKEAKTLEEYRRLRDAAVAEQAEAQLELANWCHRHGLDDQERAHLTRSLDLNPNQPVVRERLGMVLVDGVWLSRTEVREAQARGKQALKDLKRWTPRVEKLRAALNRPAGRQRDLALEQIRSLRDPSAILALETMLAPADEDGALAVVDALAQMHVPEAAVALARLASFSESADVVDVAVERLKQQPMHNFVPAMLASLVEPNGIQTSVIVGRNGGMLFRQAYALESADRRSLAVFDNAYIARCDGVSISVASELGASTVANRSRALEAQNRRFERINQRICEALCSVTGRQLGTKPADWWKWWNDLNEMVLQGEKGLVVSRLEETVIRIVPLHCSCLIAGTPIWTDRGAVAVDEMQVGDRVLAQDPISGELAYKPVLRTTVRDKSALVYVTLRNEEIVASGGHPFWVAGRGWVNARRLEPGMLLHGVDGAVPIESVRIEEEGNQPVYNLVVEDFHDYFAGEAHLLLHDITPREPTRGPLPGLEDRPTDKVKEQDVRAKGRKELDAAAS